MKIFRIVALSLALCAIGVVSTKQLKKKEVAVSNTQVTPQPVIQPLIVPVRPITNAPVTRSPVVKEPVINKKRGLLALQMHLIPTDKNSLEKFDLCPLFVEQELFIEPSLLIELDAETIKQLYASQKLLSTPKYHVFKNGQFETENVNVHVPCSIKLGHYDNWNRTLMQIKTLDQFELAEKSGLSAAMCGGLSLNNGRLICEYVRKGDQEYLRKLHNINDATNFLLNLKIGDWINAEVLRDNLVNLRQYLGTDGINVSAISTVSLFDSNLDKTAGFAVFNPEEFAYVQMVKKNIQEGLTKDNYVHIMIIGNEEAVETLGHYFCFAIIKVGNEIQYVVLDTIPTAYHLQAGSHERDRLMFVIENVEQGSSLINVTNLRTRFLR